MIYVVRDVLVLWQEKIPVMILIMKPIHLLNTMMFLERPATLLLLNTPNTFNPPQIHPLDIRLGANIYFLLFKF